MAYTYVKPSSIHDPVTGTVAPATWGDGVNVALDLLAPNACLVRRAAVQSINDSATTTITFDTEDIDDNSFYAAGTPTRITFPRKGIYLIDVSVQFAADADGVRLVTMPRGGGASDRGQYSPAINGYETDVAFSFLTTERAAGDYYEFAVWHNAGGALDITARVAISLIQDRT
jgi:hypothetical protein